MESYQPADSFLKQIKKAIDQSIARDGLIVTFLEWLQTKAASVRELPVQSPYRPSAIRAFYFALARRHDRVLTYARALTSVLADAENIFCPIFVSTLVNMFIDGDYIRTFTRGEYMYEHRYHRFNFLSYLDLDNGIMPHSIKDIDIKAMGNVRNLVRSLVYDLVLVFARARRNHDYNPSPYDPSIINFVRDLYIDDCLLDRVSNLYNDLLKEPSLKRVGDSFGNYVNGAFVHNYNCDRNRNRDFDNALDLIYNRALDLVRALDLNLLLDNARDRDLDLARALDDTHNLVGAPNFALDRALVRVRARAHALTDAYNDARDDVCDDVRAHAHARTNARADTLKRVLKKAHDDACKCKLSNLANELEGLRNLLPKAPKELMQWWQQTNETKQTNGQEWTEKLRQVMMQHRSIGDKWFFGSAEKQRLQRYYDANKFLVNLMKIEGAVTEPVRTEIKDSLLLPPHNQQQSVQLEEIGRSQCK